MSTTASQGRVLVVGAGPGGLTAAMILARRGFQVTVFEARSRVGGRNGCIELGPYRFDIGPTFLMLKGILDEVFHEAGASSESLLSFRRLDPMYRLQFAERRLEPTDDPARMRAEIARVFPGHEAGFDRFYARERARFARMLPCLQKSYHRIGSLLSPTLLQALPHLALGRSLFDVMNGYFREEELALSFTFQSKYLGMSPWMCPGLFAMIPYIEHAFGIFHVDGGLSRISDAMADVVRQNGGEIRLETPVQRILADRGAARGVRLADGSEIRGDAVVLNADFGHAMSTLFDPGILRRYAPERLARLKLSCSTYMLYLGLDAAYDIPHHTIVFARDYRANIGAIFGGRRVGPDLSFYVRHAGVTDPGLAPAGHSALYILVPVANQRSGLDWQADAAAFREQVLDAAEQRVPLPGLRRHIRAERAITPLDWQQDYRVFEGATFNLAHGLDQMITWRPRNQFEELDNVYLVGGGTHPGSGLPTIYESGRIAANLLSRRYRVPFLSGNLAV